MTKHQRGYTIFQCVSRSLSECRKLVWSDCTPRSYIRWLLKRLNSRGTNGFSNAIFPFWIVWNQAVSKCEFFWLRKLAKRTNIFPKSGFSHVMTHFCRKLFDAGFRWKIRSKMNLFLKNYKTQLLWGNIKCSRTSRELNDSQFCKSVLQNVSIPKNRIFCISDRDANLKYLRAHKQETIDFVDFYLNYSDSKNFIISTIFIKVNNTWDYISSFT